MVESITSKLRPSNLQAWMRAWESTQAHDTAEVSVKEMNRKKAESILYKDSLASLHDDFRGVITIPPPSRPKLERPELNDAKQLRSLFEAQQNQRKSKQEAGEAAITAVFKHQNHLKELQNQAKETHEEMAKNAKKTSLASWIQRFLTGSLLASFLGKLILSYFTGGLGLVASVGAAATTAFSYLGGALAIAQGASTSFKMYWDNKGREHSKEIFIIREKRDTTQKKVEKDLNQLKKGTEEENQHFVTLKKILKAARQAFRALIN
jgi:hypothetical protein